MGKIIFYDLETTGVNPAKNGIHQISGKIEIDGKIIESFNWKVKPNPKAVIEAEALAIGGITEEDLKSDAYMPMEQCFSEFISMLSRYVDRFKKTDKFHLCGYNNRGFDDQFLRGFFLQNGDQYFGSWFWSDSLDVMVLASQHLLNFRSQMENFKLGTVVKQLGIEVDDSRLHDAMYDIDLTIQAYKIIVGENL